MFFGKEAERGVIERQVKEWRGLQEEDLARYWEILQDIDARHKGNPGLPFWKMTLRYGMLQSEALMDWCDECLRELQKLQRAPKRHMKTVSAKEKSHAR